MAIDNRGHLKVKLRPSFNPATGLPESILAPYQAHVLDFMPPLVRTSKHAAGRTLPMTKEQRRKRGKQDRDLRKVLRNIFLDQQALARALADA